MKHKKAGMPEKTVVGLLLILVMMIVMMFFQAKVEDLKEKKLGKAICKSSVYAYSRAKIAGLEFASEINCPTERLPISGDDKENIMNKLALAMYDCWDQFGRGRLNLFSNENKEEKHCVICHVIEFDEKTDISSEKFRRYLKTHNVPSGEMSFWEFFLGHSTYEEDKEKQYITESYDINIESKYSTVFVYGKEGYLSKWATGALGGSLGSIIAGTILIPFTGGGSVLVGAVSLVGGASGAIIGYNMGSDRTADWNASIVLLPYIPELLYNLSCTYAPVGQEKE